MKHDEESKERLRVEPLTVLYSSSLTPARPAHCILKCSASNFINYMFHFNSSGQPTMTTRYAPTVFEAGRAPSEMHGGMATWPPTEKGRGGPPRDQTTDHRKLGEQGTALIQVPLK